MSTTLEQNDEPSRPAMDGGAAAMDAGEPAEYWGQTEATPVARWYGPDVTIGVIHAIYN